MNNAKRVTVWEPIDIQAMCEEESEIPKLKVAAYARVSTEQDEQQSSYEAQVDYYGKYIRSNPAWEFVGIYADEGITGTNTKKRDGFNRMIADAKAGKIDLILTKSISRFARNTVDTLQTVRELSALKIEVIFEKEGIRTLDKQCEVMLTIMSSLAQEESRSISENVRWGMQKSMQDGNISLPYARKSQDQQKYRAKFNKFVQQIDEQKKRMAVLKAEELKLVGMREKLHRFTETLKNCKDATVFKEQEWNNLVERIVVKPDSLDFEFKNGEKIKITI